MQSLPAAYIKYSAMEERSLDCVEQDIIYTCIPQPQNWFLGQPCFNPASNLHNIWKKVVMAFTAVFKGQGNGSSSGSVYSPQWMRLRV
jgi:hypothetical protein